MRKLVILRGVPASGKSTLLENLDLLPFTISFDTLRMLKNGLFLNVDGNLVIPEPERHDVKDFYEKSTNLILERMEKGQFIVLDNTNLVERDLKTIKKAAEEYRYQVYEVDMTRGISFEELLARDSLRAIHKQVGYDCIARMYLKYEKMNALKWAQPVAKENVESEILSTENLMTDVSSYKKVRIYGDIHSCYTVLKNSLEDFSPNTLYVFCGDYLERGIEDIETLDYLMNLSKKSNCIFLEGNHEKYLMEYASDETITSHRFSREVAPKLDASYLSKKDMRQFYRKLRKMLYLKIGEQKILVTHGGLPNVPARLPLVPESQIIRGVGDYNTDIDELFNKNLKESNVYQVHGHRNLFKHDVIVGNSINLEGKVEDGLYLRAVEFDGFSITLLEFKNTVFDISRILEKVTEDMTVEQFVKALESNDYVRKVHLYGDVYAFNFTSTAFYDGVWNDLSIRSRGLHIDTKENKIIARGFDKFFNDTEYDISDLFEGSEDHER